jgi:hypothetical protein
MVATQTFADLFPRSRCSLAGLAFTAFKSSAEGTAVPELNLDAVSAPPAS